MTRPVQHPGQLIRECRLMVPVIAASAVLSALMFIDLPWLRQTFGQTVNR